ncbi:MAG: DUF4097 family beta strand repeat protein [Gemmatimonadota bacterium]|nr:DUF4097 family beta strand repeat protein [Gemmatimonadota bacterium]
MRAASFGLLITVIAATPAAAQSRRDDGRLFGRRDRDRIDTTVAIRAGGTVALIARQGSIDVRTGSAASVTVRAASDRGRLRFDATGDRVSVDASDAGGDGRIEVTVPAGVRVTAQSMNGDVSVRGTGADVSAHTQNGDVTVQRAAGHVDLGTLAGDITASDLKGSVSANSVSGDVSLTGVNGGIDAASVSGDLTLRDVTSQMVNAQSTSGDVTYDGTIDPAGRYGFTTHSGDVSLTIPARASAQLTVSTWSGSIDSDFPITLQPGEHDIGVATSKRFTFSIGGGEARITAESFGGDIVIHRRGAR